jgi:hypothetical protein
VDNAHQKDNRQPSSKYRAFDDVRDIDMRQKPPTQNQPDDNRQREASIFDEQSECFS